MKSPAKRKRPTRTSDAAGSGEQRPATSSGDDEQRPSDAEAAAEPHRHGKPTAFQKMLTLAVMVHLLALAVGSIAARDPSQTVSELSGWFGPYLQMLHFASDDRPVDLARGDAREQPLSLLVTESLPDDSLAAGSSPADSSSKALRAVESSLSGDGLRSALPPVLPGAGADDRQQRWLGTLTLLADRDQPSLVAELLQPALKQAASPTRPAFVRIVRHPTVLSADDSDDPPPYEAWIMPSGNPDAPDWSIVCRQPRRLTAIATGDSESKRQTDRTTGREVEPFPAEENRRLKAGQSNQ